MAKAVLLLLIFFALAVPGALLAEELLPAICEQVLSPDKDTSIAKIIQTHFVEKAKTIPSEIIQDVKEVAGSAANSIGKSLGAYKDATTSKFRGSVLGTSTRATIETSPFNILFRYWVWGAAGLGLLAAWLIFRR
ncbi:MAG: hypothetical protein A2758_00890 [Candidatus Zambryskibacteria bacterium RIFCSPHIGHO2_01_FULL_49_18]|uniref:Uncharacterized protein n=2 Tax=Candidatus Zambryskiibacteriota TaxID=1817925 RepID=A0A1G2T2X5_9BACT|nr:MAG: hypothetical protein A2758_00890 [Candidatus Zambryskibacteria bacterium RIFCSPHIGHO2_01_FULL_49_18]OHB05740.1 MAG: hypothetical protein A3A26_03595 [Candidatus Zambryskibacteria bacterium RIFCSPLOWO2_01_FULL_47_14]